MQYPAQNGWQPAPGHTVSGCPLQDAHPAPASGYKASRSLAIILTAQDRRHPDGVLYAFDQKEPKSAGGNLFRKQSPIAAWTMACRTQIEQWDRHHGQHQPGPTSGTRRAGELALARRYPGAEIASFCPRPVAMPPSPYKRALVRGCSTRGGNRAFRATSLPVFDVLLQHSTKLPTRLILLQTSGIGRSTTPAGSRDTRQPGCGATDGRIRFEIRCRITGGQPVIAAPAPP